MLLIRFIIQFIKNLAQNFFQLFDVCTVIVFCDKRAMRLFNSVLKPLDLACHFIQHPQSQPTAAGDGNVEYDLRIHVSPRLAQAASEPVGSRHQS